MKDYRQVGLEAYGTKCEWIGCGWDAAPCEVHHINYQEHQAKEDALSKESGHKVQLPKSVEPKDLSVLCPNHHTFTHHLDQGQGIRKYIPERK